MIKRRDAKAQRNAENDMKRGDRMTKTVFEKSQKSQKAFSLPREDATFQKFHPIKDLVRQSPIPLPELSEIDLTRHFASLAHRNVGIDTTFYPLGSCTMKLNPRVNEWAASLPQFTRTHPLAPDESVQGQPPNHLRPHRRAGPYLRNGCGLPHALRWRPRRIRGDQDDCCIS